MNGKGDTPRPLSVTPEQYASNYERTFGPRIANDRCYECGELGKHRDDCPIWKRRNEPVARY